MTVVNTVIQEGIVSLQKGDLKSTVQKSETLARDLVGSHPNEDVRAIAGLLVDAAGRLNAKLSGPTPAIDSVSQMAQTPAVKTKDANVRVRNLNKSLIPTEKPNLSGMNNARKAALTRKQAKPRVSVPPVPPPKLSTLPAVTSVSEPLMPREPPKARITTWKSPRPVNARIQNLEKLKNPREKSNMNFTNLFAARKASVNGPAPPAPASVSIFNRPLPMEGPEPSSANNLMKSYKGQAGGKLNKTKKRNR